MKVDIYRVRKDPDPTERRYVLIPSDIDASALLEKLRADLGELEYERTIDIHPGEKRIALDSDEAITNIHSMGYHIQGARIQTRLSVG